MRPIIFAAAIVIAVAATSVNPSRCTIPEGLERCADVRCNIRRQCWQLSRLNILERLRAEPAVAAAVGVRRRRQYCLSSRSDDLDNRFADDAPASGLDAWAAIEAGFAPGAGLLNFGRRQNTQQRGNDIRIVAVDIDADEIPTCRSGQNPEAGTVTAPGCALGLQRGATVEALSPINETNPLSAAKEPGLFCPRDDGNDGIAALKQAFGIFFERTAHGVLSKR